MMIKTLRKKQAYQYSTTPYVYVYLYISIFFLLYIIQAEIRERWKLYQPLNYLWYIN